MDIGGVSRTAAVIAALTPVQAAQSPPVAGIGQIDDKLLSRVAGESEAAGRTGDGDNSDLRPRQPGTEFTAAELAVLQELRASDREVRAHEMAHLAAAGRHSRGGPSFSFESGPDGRRYAVAGEVSIDTAVVPGDPAATLAKAQQVRRAALAPANPSSQDRQIAAQAAAMAAQASVQLAQQRNQPDAGADAANAVSQKYAPATETTTPLIELVA